MSEHATLPPSSADEWGVCHNWLAMHEGLEHIDSEEAEWGNECHDLGERGLRAATLAQPMPTHSDLEMYDTAKMYVDHCVGLMRQASVFGGPSLGIEERVTATRLVWGTLDFRVYDAAHKVLHIRDLKSGRLLVSPRSNQLALYAQGVLNEMGLGDLGIVLDLGVVQPRGFHREGPIRTVQMLATDLRPKLNDLEYAAEANASGEHPATAGPHCRNCDARFRCPAALGAMSQWVQFSVKGGPLDPTPQEIGLLLSHTRAAMKHLKKMEEAFEGVVESRVRGGEIVPGWTTGTVQGHAVWDRPREEVLLLGELFGRDLDSPGLRTPAQAKAAGVPEEMVTLYSKRPKKGVKIIEYEAGEAARVFSNNNMGTTL